MPLRFGDVVLDLDRFELGRDGEVVPVERQVFAVLAHLVEQRHRVVPKSELLDRVWGDRFVSESALTSRIKSARQAVGDTGRDQRVIKTVHGVGYRFVAEIHDDEPSDPVPRTASASDPLAQVLELLPRGSGAAIEVVGARGAGKARRVDEIVRRALDSGIAVGRATAAAVDPCPYRAVLDALHELASRRPGVVDSLGERCAAQLRDAFAGHPPAVRQHLFLAARGVAVGVASMGGAVLVVEGIHYADDATVELLRFLAPLTTRHPLVIVASHRPGRPLGEPFQVLELDTTATRVGQTVAELPIGLRHVLQRVALLGERFDVATWRACTDEADTATADRLLEVAFVDGIIEDHGGELAFADADLADRLAAEVPAHRRLALLESLAERLADAGARPHRVASVLVEAGRPDLAVGPALAAARDAIESGLHREAVTWVNTVFDHADPADRPALHAVRADALGRLGDPGAVAAYRQALSVAPPDAQRLLRARLARVALGVGDLDTLQEAAAGLDADGDQVDGEVLMAVATAAYFRGDLATAESTLATARQLALVPGASPRMLDAIALQGLIAHSRGEWFDRLRREMRAELGRVELASTLFDAHLCVAEYLLYGPTPYQEVIRLAAGLRESGERSGARPAVAFATVLAGEAALLAGDLEQARALLEEGRQHYQELQGEAGEAHALQRLAEVALACGNPREAEQLARRALPLARWSTVARHLLQRIYGTLVAAAPDAAAALAVVDEAAAVLDEPGACELCDVMIEVPAAIACAEGGRLDEARDRLDRAEVSARLWEGTAWSGAIDEARAALARAEGDEPRALALLRSAAAQFEAAGQPLDAARCREAADDVDDVDEAYAAPAWLAAPRSETTLEEPPGDMVTP